MKEKILNLMEQCEMGGYGTAVKKCARALRLKGGRYVFTPNAEMLSELCKRKELYPVFRRAYLLLPDGIGIYLAMRLCGIYPKERTCGIELCQRLFARLSASGTETRVFLLGGREGVAREAAKKLARKYQYLRFCGAYCGYFDAHGEENERVIELIKKSGASLLIVGMGFPRQEEWIARNLSRLPSVCLAIGVGGSLDVWSGRIPRAPETVQKMGLEWLFRIFKEPSRLARLPRLAEFSVRIISEAAPKNK